MTNASPPQEADVGQHEHPFAPVLLVPTGDAIAAGGGVFEDGSAAGGRVGEGPGQLIQISGSTKNAVTIPNCEFRPSPPRETNKNAISIPITVRPNERNSHRLKTSACQGTVNTRLRNGSFGGGESSSRRMAAWASAKNVGTDPVRGSGRVTGSGWTSGGGRFFGWRLLVLFHFGQRGDADRLVAVRTLLPSRLLLGERVDAGGADRADHEHHRPVSFAAAFGDLCPIRSLFFLNAIGSDVRQRFGLRRDRNVSSGGDRHLRVTIRADRHLRGCSASRSSSRVPHTGHGTVINRRSPDMVCRIGKTPIAAGGPRCERTGGRPNALRDRIEISAHNKGSNGVR